MVNGIPKPYISFVGPRDIADLVLLPTDYLGELLRIKLSEIAHLAGVAKGPGSDF